MKINVDRLCELAGLSSEGGTVLTEASNTSLRDDPALSDEAEYRFGKGQLAEGSEEEAEETMSMEEDEEAMEEEALDEMIEIDEAMLVQELRRAKAMLSEAKTNKQNLEEAQLRQIIESEVADVMKELNLTGGWVYGENKPQASKKGFVHQGSFMKGIGFK
tara:strand:+ start:59 stop:541 length:483 start_codon:yes stop_codon:yes gene_type:complete